MATEEFKKTLGGELVSSRGFRVRILGRLGLSYEDARGRIVIDSERLVGRRPGVWVFTRSIEDADGRAKADVLDDLRRAFDFAGWTLHLDTSGDDNCGDA